MKKIKYLLFVILFCLFTNVKAVDDCTTEEMNRLRELANKVDFKLNYDIKERIEEDENGEKSVVDVWASYTIQIVNDNSDLKYYYRVNGKGEKKIITQSELSKLNFIDGNYINFEIYSYTDNYCTNEILRTVKVELPKYNVYYHYHKEKCGQYPEFKFCKEFLKVNKDDTEIDKLFEEYINNNKKEDNIIKNNGLVSNYKYIIIGSILLITLIITFLIIFNKKRKEQI